MSDELTLSDYTPFSRDTSLANKAQPSVNKASFSLKGLGLQTGNKIMIHFHKTLQRRVIVELYTGNTPYRSDVFILKEDLCIRNKALINTLTKSGIKGRPHTVTQEQIRDGRSGWLLSWEKK